MTRPEPTVPVEPFRIAVARSELSKAEIARRIGYCTEVAIGGQLRKHPQTSRLNNALKQKSIGIGIARLLCSVLDLDPRKVGLTDG